MISIKKLDFDDNAPDKIKKLKIDGKAFGEKWPVVYIITNNKEAYVGETTNVFNRMKQHLENPDRRKLKGLCILTDETFNKSVILDLESFLIKYMQADDKFVLQNGNGGIQNHNYYNKNEYEREFKEVWKVLKQNGLVQNELLSIENTDLFKYSPYKALTVDQSNVVKEILSSLSNDLKNDIESSTVVKGGAGTGKTILGIYIMKLLMDKQRNKIQIEEEQIDEDVDTIVREAQKLDDLKIGIVIPMTSLRNTLKKVFKKIDGLNPNMVLAPGDPIGKNYDLLIVDETHRLKKRKAIAQYGQFDINNRKLGFGHEGTQLDWITKSSKHQIFFYDGDQSIKPADIDHEQMNKLMLKSTTHVYELKSQMRCLGGNDYIDYVKSIFSNNPPAERIDFSALYDLKLFDNMTEMYDAIEGKENEHGLCRFIATYAWPWISKGKKYKDIVNNDLYDFEIDGVMFFWNTTEKDYINSIKALNEVGCIHTTQGYDLNYAGVIIGEDVKYDEKYQCIYVDPSNHYDRNGKVSIDENQFFEYVMNICCTIMTRGIKGTYIYVCNDALRQYIKKWIPIANIH